ncbi:hypothetical protein [Carnimonas bestiolae]
MFLDHVDSPITQSVLLATGYIAVLLVDSGPLRPALAIGVVAPTTLQ